MANTTSYVSYSHAASGSADLEFFFTTVFTGSYVPGAGNGETINALTAVNANGLELGGFLPSGGGDVGFPNVMLENFLGYQLLYTALSNGSFTARFFVMDTGAELAAEAFPAAITGGQLNFSIRHRG